MTGRAVVVGVRVWLAGVVVWLAIVPGLILPAAQLAAEADLPGIKAGKTGDSAAAAKKFQQFIRTRRDSNGSPVALETAILRYEPKDKQSAAKYPGLVVDLVSVVHVGEKSYYEQLNKQFTGYDCVLYELVAPEGTRIPKGGGQRSAHPVSALQQLLKSMLALEFQLEHIDYTAENMVHADLSPEQFSAAMRQRGESWLTMMLRIIGYAMAREGASKSSDVELLRALFDKNRALALKRVMAEQFEEMGGSLMVFDPPEGSALITDRNKAAMQVLHKQIEAGKRKIAIFYGGAHMPDFDQRLQKELALKPTSTRWLVAWDLTDKQQAKVRKEQPKALQRQ